MVFEKKQLSKVVAIFMIVACAVAFMPLLNGQAFAAAKKPGKAKITSAKVSGTSVTIKYKATNAKTYNIKVDKKVVKKNYKKKTYKISKLAPGKHKIYVQGVNGKKKGKWSKAKTVTIKAVPSAVTIEGTANVGETLTAVVVDKNGKPITSGVTYQWYRVNNATGVTAAIAGANKATYQITAADGPQWTAEVAGMATYSIYVEAKVGGKTFKSEPTKAVTSVRTLASVEIVLPDGHTAPQVGDVLKLKITDTLGDKVLAADVDEIEWSIGGIVKGSGSTFTVPAGDDYLGQAIVAKVTAEPGSYMGVQYGYNGTVTSAATAGIIKSTTPEGVKVSFEAAAPYVGETIEAVFTPEGTSDANATYQWYRGSAMIAGATSKTYTVTAQDKGAALKVVATLSNDNKTQLTSAATPVVKEQLTGAAVSVKSNNAELNTIYTTSDNAIATVTVNGKAPETGISFGCAWYLDSVEDANQLFTNAFNTAVKDFEQTAAGSEGTLDLSGNYFLYKGTKETSIVGHKLIAVASTTAASIKQGSATSEPTAAVQIKLEAKGEIGSDAFAITKDTNDYVAGKTTLSVKNIKDYGDDVTVTADYKWYTRTASNAPWTAVGTGETYLIPADAAGNGVGYKVEVTGTGDFYGTLKDETTAASINVLPATTKVTANPIILVNGKTQDYAQVGDTLTASATVVAAADPRYMDWTWHAVDADSKAIGTDGTGQTYVVPEKAKTVTLTATPKVSDYEVTQTAAVSVKDVIASVTLSSSADVAGTTQDPAGHDGVASPYVGETLTAVAKNAAGTVISGATNVTYQWYAGDAKIKNATNASYTLTADEVGKKVYCEVTGTPTGSVGGSVKASDPTGEVGVIGAISVSRNGSPVGNADKVYVGNTLDAAVAVQCYGVAGTAPTGKLVAVTNADIVAGVNELATFTWTIGESKTATGASYTVVEADGPAIDTSGNPVYKTIKCEAAGVTAAAEGALVWNPGLVIEGNTEVAQKAIRTALSNGEFNVALSEDGKTGAVLRTGTTDALAAHWAAAGYSLPEFTAAAVNQGATTMTVSNAVNDAGQPYLALVFDKAPQTGDKFTFTIGEVDYVATAGNDGATWTTALDAQ